MTFEHYEFLKSKEVPDKWVMILCVSIGVGSLL